MIIQTLVPVRYDERTYLLRRGTHNRPKLNQGCRQYFCLINLNQRNTYGALFLFPIVVVARREDTRLSNSNSCVTFLIVENLFLPLYSVALFCDVVTWHWGVAKIGDYLFCLAQRQP